MCDACLSVWHPRFLCQPLLQPACVRYTAWCHGDTAMLRAIAAILALGATATSPVSLAPQSPRSSPVSREAAAALEAVAAKLAGTSPAGLCRD